VLAFELKIVPQVGVVTWPL